MNVIVSNCCLDFVEIYLLIIWEAEFSRMPNNWGVVVIIGEIENYLKISKRGLE